MLPWSAFAQKWIQPEITTCMYNYTHQTRERGTGLDRVQEPGPELGTPESQWRYMSTHCPRGYWHQQMLTFKSKINVKVFSFTTVMNKNYWFYCLKWSYCISFQKKWLTFPVLCIALSELDPEVLNALPCLTDCVVTRAKEKKKVKPYKCDC